MKASRVTVRFAPEVLGEHKRLAHEHGQSLAGFIRDHLETVITPTEPWPAPPDDAWEWWLTACPPEIQVAVRRAVDLTGMGVVDVLRAWVITAVAAAEGAQPRGSGGPVRPRDMAFPPV
jgi:hypothetical protein